MHLYMQTYPLLSHHHQNYQLILKSLSALTCLPAWISHPPSTHPCLSHTTSPTICAVGSPWVCQFPSVSWLGDPSSLPPASESWTPPLLSDPAAPPRLLAPLSPPLPISPPASPGSFLPPAPPWTPAAPCHSIPPAPLGAQPPELIVASS
ncbi:hypothetical protein M9458_042918 [Cirrhinus mrigala]|uniref:Uncharacterized protein n=1 Tax=Cirrhinus mrigala TaxID=683832 RepID=A0ABD0NBX5_CIRMR